MYGNVDISGYVGLAFYFFNICCIIYFKKQKLEKLSYVIPVWNVLLYSFIILLAVIVTIIPISTGTDHYPLILTSNFGILLELISSTFQIIFSFYLLNKLY